MGKVLNSITDKSFSILKFISIIFHLWTAFIAFKIDGIIAAIISLVAPFLSEVYWGYEAWKLSSFDSPYVQWGIVLFVLWIVLIIFGIFAAFISAKDSKSNMY